jgi:hypothetical protein
VIALASAAAAGAAACGKVEDIHETAEARGKPCVDCHRSAYVAAVNPKHVGQMPETCEKCHNTKAWVPATGGTHDWFPLRNKHATSPCAQCHTKGYQPGDTPKACVGCHQKDFDAAKNPPHTNYSTACETCHTDAGWRPAVFNHPWPLNGKHASTDCFACHTGSPPRYLGTPKDCASCHQKSYDAAASPSHAGFPTTCADCHNETAWRPSTFVHPWYLDGVHATQPCASCHKGSPPVYRGTSRDCVTCHLDDYNASPYPGHATFPKTCEDCHGRAAWKPAIGGAHPEAKFFIATGAHAKPGISCTSCHDPARGSSVGGANTNCIGCHLGSHTRAKMDDKHSGVNNYPRNTTSVNFCRDCHPTGKK